MKKSIYLFAAIMFAGGIILTSCESTSQQKVENAEENVSEAKQDLHEAEMDYSAAIHDFRRETDERITTNEKYISDLKLQTENEKKELREERRKKIAELETRNNDMKKRMNEYNDNGKDGWESFKREFNRDMDELGNALNNLTVNNKK